MRRERPRLARAKADPRVSAGSLTPQVSVSVMGRALRPMVSCCWPRRGQCLRDEVARHRVNPCSPSWAPRPLRNRDDLNSDELGLELWFAVFEEHAHDFLQ